MNIVSKDKQGLVHSYGVVVSASEIENVASKELENLGRDVKIKGFRKGRAPVAVLKQRYNHEAYSKALDWSVNQSIDKILKDNKIIPAVSPEVSFAKPFEEGHDLELLITVEVLPEVKLPDFEKIELTKYTAKIADKDIKSELEYIAKNLGTAAAAKEKRAIAENDVVTVDLLVKDKNGKEVTSRTRKDCLIAVCFDYVHAHHIPNELNKKIVGKKVGDTLEHTVETDSGAPFTYQITLKDLHDFTPAEINDDLAQKMGLQDLAMMKDYVKQNITKNIASGTFWLLKRHVLDTLAKEDSFDLPDSLVNDEFKMLWNNFEIEYDKATQEEKDNVDRKQEEEEYTKIAARRVRLGLLIGKIAKDYNVGITEQDSKQEMAHLLSSLGGDRKKLTQFLSSESNVQRIRADLLEKKVVEFISSKSKIQEKQVSRQELDKMVSELVESEVQ